MPTANFTPGLCRWKCLKESGEDIKGELLRLDLGIAAGNKIRNLLVYLYSPTKPLETKVSMFSFNRKCNLTITSNLVH